MPDPRVILLLFALLPGLLVPAGIGLDRCECTGEWRVVYAGAARPCASEAPVQPRVSAVHAELQRCPVSKPNACCHRNRERVAVADGCAVTAADDRVCECGVVIVADAPTKWVGGTLRLDLEPLALPTMVLTLLPLPTCRVELAPCGPRGPPPPGRFRNLPLLL